MMRKREIISFGDSMEERTAVRIVSGQLSAVPKSIMFISSPSPLQLIGQLNMVTLHMKFVCEHESSLDLEISPLAGTTMCRKVHGKDVFTGFSGCWGFCGIDVKWIGVGNRVSRVACE
jgi:hypothetical protein